MASPILIIGHGRRSSRHDGVQNGTYRSPAD